jgi:hypothetical protein
MGAYLFDVLENRPDHPLSARKHDPVPRISLAVRTATGHTAFLILDVRKPQGKRGEFGESAFNGAQLGLEALDAAHAGRPLPRRVRRLTVERAWTSCRNRDTAQAKWPVPIEPYGIRKRYNICIEQNCHGRSNRNERHDTVDRAVEHQSERGRAPDQSDREYGL